MRLYPAAANVHEGGILITSRVPADLPEDVARRAAELARFVAERLELVGVCCVEMFVMPDDGLAVNEVAPRPHNSGHYTLDACTVSQFEQQARALCGLPLGDAELLASAVMVNLIGDAFTEALQPDGVRAIMETPRAVLHVYGKRAVRPGRKMGHITILRGRADEAWDAASLLRRRLQDAAAAAARA
jgi:5-(carboxyamino)imidazole ribonucleotide synthase